MCLVTAGHVKTKTQTIVVLRHNIPGTAVPVGPQETFRDDPPRPRGDAKVTRRPVVSGGLDALVTVVLLPDMVDNGVADPNAVDTVLGPLGPPGPGTEATPVIASYVAPVVTVTGVGDIGLETRERLGPCTVIRAKAASEDDARGGPSLADAVGVHTATGTSGLAMETVVPTGVTLGATPGTLPLRHSPSPTSSFRPGPPRVLLVVCTQPPEWPRVRLHTLPGLPLP